MKFHRKSLLLKAAFLGAFVTALWMPLAKSQSCAPLTLSAFPNGGFFTLDDENLSADPLFVEMNVNPRNGALTGSVQIGSYSSSLTGSATQVGTNGLLVNFSWELPPFTFNYTGAISVLGQSCAMFLAGTYTETTMLYPLPPTTSGPYPFSGRWSRGPN